jgi:hypothetical protein
MMYLCIIFLSPLYFMIRGKWGGFVLNSILYGLACFCVISIIGIMIAPLFWMLAVGHASWSLRRELMEQNAIMIAEKMAEQMVKHQSARPSQPPLPEEQS